MKIIKTFESWNSNVIDKSLFSSGKAKYDPKVVNGTIKYNTGNKEPYYFAEITQKGDSFICKIYKMKKNGEKIRLRNKMKKELKLAHNYVREYLNQKLKKKPKSKKSKSKNSDDRNLGSFTHEPMRSAPEIPESDFMDQTPTPKRRRTIIRKY